MDIITRTTMKKYILLENDTIEFFEENYLE